MEPDLFDVTANYHRGNTQSVEANKIAHKGKVGARQRIIKEIQDLRTSYTGLTCEEIEHLTGLSHQTCSARLSELRREGKIKIVGIRKTKSESPAAVYQEI